MENGDEFKDIIRQNYLKLFDREPDKDGMNSYFEQLKTGKISPDELPEILKKSREYRHHQLMKPGDLNLTISERMKKDWDDSAKTDAKFFIKTNVESDKEFWESGKEECERILGINTPRYNQIIDNKNSKEMRVLEIGCGIGRILIPMAEIFGEAVGVDVSAKMVEMSQKYLKNIQNCKIYHNDGYDLSMFPDDHFDFCYSFIVFQHIPEKNIVKNYIKEVSRVLKNGGIFRFQVHGDSDKNPVDGTTWNGVHFTTQEMHYIAKIYKFEILEEEGRNDQYYWLTFRSTKTGQIAKLLTTFTSQITNLNDSFSKKIIEKFMPRIKSGLQTNYDHYKDKYWNNLDLVQRYINKESTGNEDTIWQIDILSRFREYIPFQEVLIIGCGNGWVERQLYDLGIGLHFDAFDISEKYLETARGLVEKRNIRYFKDDINNLQNLEDCKYDAIFNVGVLHHTFRLANTMWKLSKSLKPKGLMFNFDYVGPPKNQYSNEHLSILKLINSEMPKRFQSIHSLRPARRNFEFGDPTEAIHSDLVKSNFERFFNILYEKDLNGGVAYQILWNNIDEFMKNDEEAIKVLSQLVERDKEYTVQKKIPVLFWYSVGTPKSRENISNDITLPP